MPVPARDIILSPAAEACLDKTTAAEPCRFQYDDNPEAIDALYEWSVGKMLEDPDRADDYEAAKIGAIAIMTHEIKERGSIGIFTLELLTESVLLDRESQPDALPNHTGQMLQTEEQYLAELRSALAQTSDSQANFTDTQHFNDALCDAVEHIYRKIRKRQQWFFPREALGWHELSRRRKANGIKPDWEFNESPH